MRLIPQRRFGVWGKIDGCSTIRRKPANPRLETLISYWIKMVNVISIVFVFLYLRLSAVYSRVFAQIRLVQVENVFYDKNRHDHHHL